MSAPILKLLMEEYEPELLDAIDRALGTTRLGTHQMRAVGQAVGTTLSAAVRRAYEMGYREALATAGTAAAPAATTAAAPAVEAPPSPSINSPAPRQVASLPASPAPYDPGLHAYLTATRAAQPEPTPAVGAGSPTSATASPGPAPIRAMAAADLSVFGAPDVASASASDAVVLVDAAVSLDDAEVDGADDDDLEGEFDDDFDDLDADYLASGTASRSGDDLGDDLDDASAGDDEDDPAEGEQSVDAAIVTGESAEAAEARAARVEAYVREHDGSKATDIAKALGLPGRVVSQELSRLERKARIHQVGKTRGARYHAGPSSKSAFILAHPRDTPAKVVVEAALAVGMTFDERYVHAIRSAKRRKAREARKAREERKLGKAAAGVVDQAGEAAAASGASADAPIGAEACAGGGTAAPSPGGVGGNLGEE